QRSAFLRFRASWHVDPRDVMGAQYSTGRSTWRWLGLLAPFDDDDDEWEGEKPRTSGGWRDYRFDLRHAAGLPDVRVRFVYVTFGRLGNALQGLQIDDV